MRKVYALAIVIAVAGSAGPQSPAVSGALGQTNVPAPADIERTDWLTFAHGALFVRQSGMAVG